MKNEVSRFLAVAMVALLFVGCNEVNVNLNGNKNTSTAVNRNEKPAKSEANKNGNIDISRDDFEKQVEQYKQQAKEAGRKIGNGADDLWIWTKTRAALAYADDLRDSTIEVDVSNNAVTLTGSVANAAQKAKAEEIAKGIGGVQSVKNLLQLATEGKSETTPKPAAKGKEKR